MNYGAKLLGASLAILHFLRLCGVLGDIMDMEDHYKLPLAQHPDYNYQNPNPVKAASFSGRKNWKGGQHASARPHWTGTGKELLDSDSESSASVKMRKLFEKFCPDCDPLAIDIFFQTTFHPSLQEFSLGDDTTTPSSPLTSTTANPVLDYFCNFDNDTSAETADAPHKPSRPTQTTSAHLPSFTNSPSQPNKLPSDQLQEECRYLANNKTLICDCETMTLVPSDLPQELDLFQLNETLVERLDKGAFGGSLIRTVKIHGNKQLRCMHPNAFEGVRGLGIISISNNNFDYVTPQNFRHLNETYMLYLEHNKVNLMTYGRQTDSVERLRRERWRKGGSGASEWGEWWEWEDAESTTDVASEEEDLFDEPVLPSLRYFSLMGNPLTVIPKNYFSGLRFSPVNCLILTSCQLKFIHPEALSHFPQLYELDLSENPNLMVNILEAFEGLQGSNLTDLNLSSNNLDHIPTDALAQIQSTLENLDLSGNLFDDLKTDSFPSVMNTLKSLNLDNCRIRTVEQGTFRNMVNLETLVLTNNRLAHVPVSVGYLKNLISLDVSSNSPAPSLTVSIGVPSQDFQIYPSLLSELTKLRRLSLDFLPLTKIERLTFKGLVSLDYLSLQGGLVEFIHNFSFQDLHTLRILNLAGNELKQINGNTFYGLQNLETLALSSNNIQIDLPSMERRASSKSRSRSSIEGGYGDGGWSGGGGPGNPGDGEGGEEGGDGGDVSDPVNSTQPFHRLTKLRWLYLSDNRILNLSPTLFKNLPNLKFVDLSGNSITSWSSRVFNSSITNSSIEELRLANNNIGPISIGMLQDFQEIHNVAGLEGNVDISENPFVCDPIICELIRMAQNGTLSLKNWDESSYHICLNPAESHYNRMCSDFQEICKKLVPGTERTTPYSPFPELTSASSESPGQSSTSLSTSISTTRTISTSTAQPSSDPETSTTNESTDPEPQSTTDKAEPSKTSAGTTAATTPTSKSQSPSTPTSATSTESKRPSTEEATTAWPLASTPNSSLASIFRDESATSTLLSLGLAFLSFFFVSLLLLVSYKKRFHLKYFLFVVRFNLVNIPNLNISKRKASLTSYDYDIFVSYNHTDRVFIEDHLLPHVEGEELGEGHPGGMYNTVSSFDSSDYDVESLGGRSTGSQVRLTKTLSTLSSASTDSRFSYRSALRVCVHERDFKVGVPITENIVDFVDRSRKVLVVVSRNYLESQWCLYEMNLAYHRLIESGRKSFIVILLEDIPVSLRTKSLNYLLLSRTYIEWPGEKASYSEQSLFWKRLKNSLRTD